MAWNSVILSVRALIAGACCVVLGVSSHASDALWKAHVEPVLKDRCAECHSPTRSKSGLDLSSLQSMLRGGDRGPAVVPGKPDDSTLVKLLRTDSDPHMPPGSRKPLTDDEVGFIRKWIEDLPVAKAPDAVSALHAPEPAAPAVKRINWEPDNKMPGPAAVDKFLELAWALDGVTAAGRANDATFVRRVYLDLAGRIPSETETEKFLSDTSEEKRAHLIDALLASEEYARHMREVFDTVLMSRPTRRWQERRANSKWHGYLEDAFRRNRPWNDVVREIIVARPERDEQRGATWFIYERDNNPQSVAEALAPVTFGVQIKCAQCHDHMVAREIKQAHYWGMVAAFNRSKNVDTASGPAISESAIGGFVSFANLKKESQPAVLTFFNGRSVDEKRPKDGEKEVDSAELYVVPPPAGKEKPNVAAVPKFSRREALAEAVTKDNPLLAKAMVNRIWAMLFGRGIVHPVDLMDSKHAPSHPELLEWLAKDFERHGYDVKRLVQLLCSTRAYQLDSRALGNGRPPQPESFARALDKPLSAEQLYNSLLTVTRNKPDSEGKVAGRTEKELRSAFVKEFPDLFPAEYNATLQQAMFFSNSPLLDTLLVAREGNLTSSVLAQGSDEARIEKAFLSVFGRSPDDSELKRCLGFLQGRSREAGVKQLLWAMLTSAEFQLNH